MNGDAPPSHAGSRLFREHYFGVIYQETFTSESFIGEKITALVDYLIIATGAFEEPPALPTLSSPHSLLKSPACVRALSHCFSTYILDFILVCMRAISIHLYPR